jgi:hypothetical protein
MTLHALKRNQPIKNVRYFFEVFFCCLSIFIETRLFRVRSSFLFSLLIKNFGKGFVKFKNFSQQRNNFFRVFGTSGEV